MCHWLTYNSFNLLRVQRLSFDLSETKIVARKNVLEFGDNMFKLANGLLILANS